MASLAFVLLQGCAGTGGRTAAMGKLSPADREVAKQGEIKKGFSKDAVYAAWGAPSKTSTVDTSQGIRESWTYVRTFNGYGGGYYGISRGLVRGKNGSHYDTDDFYPAPTEAQTLGGTPSTDVPVKRAIFQNGSVVSYETARSDASNDDGGSNDFE